METIPLLEYRCECHRLLFKGALLTSRVQIKCKRCGKISTFGVEASATEQSAQYGLVLDADAQVTAVSDTAPLVLGYSTEELLQMHGNELLKRLPDRHTMDSWRQVETTAHDCFVFDSVQHTKAGVDMPVRVRVQYPTKDTSPHTVYLCETLDSSTPVGTKQPALVVTRHDLVAEVDCAGVFTYVSESLGALQGQSDFSLYGSRLFDVVQLPDDVSYQDVFADMAEDQGAYSLEAAALVDQAGVRHNLRLHHTPRYRDDGHLLGYAIMCEPG